MIPASWCLCCLPTLCRWHQPWRHRAMERVHCTVRLLKIVPCPSFIQEFIHTHSTLCMFSVYTSAPGDKHVGYYLNNLNYHDYRHLLIHICMHAHLCIEIIHMVTISPRVLTLNRRKYCVTDVTLSYVNRFKFCLYKRASSTWKSHLLLKALLLFQGLHEVNVTVR